MCPFETDLGPKPHEARWRAAQGRLRAGHVRIAHIDTGLAPHPALGFDGDTPPPNIAIDEGANFHESPAGHRPPVTTLERGRGVWAEATEFPDHGLKTLAIIVSQTAELRGVAPGAHVVPYRVANGPVFRDRARTAAIGSAVRHAMALANPPRVISISMGNPGFLGAFALITLFGRGEYGLAHSTREALDAAYEEGIVVVCAGGQVINAVVYPARFARTIAVGGFGRQAALYVHYPRRGYDDSGRIDVWARAEGINRPGAHLDANGVKVDTYANHPDDIGGEPKGTSYACPQVAAAAAMWIDAHGATLEAAFGAPGRRWMMVEAFRHALKLSADQRQAQDAGADGEMRDIWVLNVERLLATPPDTAKAFRKRGSCVDGR